VSFPDTRHSGIARQWETKPHTVKIDLPSEQIHGVRDAYPARILNPSAPVVISVIARVPDGNARWL